MSDIDKAKLNVQFLTPKYPKLTVCVTDCICDRQDYWSVRKEPPPEDTVNNFKLLGAMETGEYTSVRFERNLTTEEADKDVQFMVRLYNKYKVIWRGVCKR